MKKRSQKIFVLLVIGMMCLFNTNIQAADQQNEAAYMQKYQSIVQTMKIAMANVSRTGDPALDYMLQMMPHHEAAIAMADNELQYGANQKVKAMAQKTKQEQIKDMDKMKELIEKVKANPQIDKAQEAAYMTDFLQFHEAMTEAMEALKPTGNIDKDFLMGMIPHHDGAVNMSRAILRYTNNADVRKMAEETVKKQTAEIKEMNKMLKQMK